MRTRAVSWLRALARFLFNTLGLRFLLALISAFALWWFVVPGPNSDGGASPALGNYRTVSVVVQHSGTPANGYVVAGVQVAPLTVTIQGAAQVLVGVTYINTTPVDISGAKSTVTQVVPLDFPPGVSSTNASSSATVSIYITPVTGQLSAELPVVVKHLGSGLLATVTPTVVKVTLKGPVSRFGALDIEPSVDASGLGLGTYVLRVQVATPSDVSAEIEPASVTVTLNATP